MAVGEFHCWNYHKNWQSSRICMVLVYYADRELQKFWDRPISRFWMSWNWKALANCMASEASWVRGLATQGGGRSVLQDVFRSQQNAKTQQLEKSSETQVLNSKDPHKLLENMESKTLTGCLIAWLLLDVCAMVLALVADLETRGLKPALRQVWVKFWDPPNPKLTVWWYLNHIKSHPKGPGVTCQRAVLRQLVLSLIAWTSAFDSLRAQQLNRVK